MPAGRRAPKDACRSIEERVDMSRTTAIAMDCGDRVILRFAPTTSGVISWNGPGPEGRIEFRLVHGGDAASGWLEYARWGPNGATSLSASAPGIHVDVDVIVADEPFDGIDVAAPGTPMRLFAFSSPRPSTPDERQIGPSVDLDVPVRSQYEVESERGWCSAATLAMLHAFHGIDVPVPQTARAVYDERYGGTGNWSLNMAFSGRLGLHAAVVHLGGLAHARALIEHGLPIGISYGWEQDELPGAPIPMSSGHLAVLRGFTDTGDCIVNDPAADHVRVVYPRAALGRLWRRNDCIAYVIAPRSADFAALTGSPGDRSI